MSRGLAFERTLGAAACLGAILAGGCGGDDDTPGPPELLQITTVNQFAVASATAVNFAGLDTVRDAGSIGAAGTAQAAAAARSTKRALGKAIAATSAMYPLDALSGTVPCSFGGLIDVTLDDRDNSEGPSAGDVLTAAFNNCREDPLSKIEGGFAVNIADYAEPTVSGLFTFSQLRLDDPDGAIAVNGQANITYAVSLDSADTSTTRVDMRIPAAGLVAAVETASFKETFTYAPDFAALWHDVTPVGAVAYSTAALSGKVAFTSLGKVLLATDPPFGYVHDMDGPQSGAVLITGHQSKLRLSVVSTTTARLELDANNDGTFESTRDIPWNELLQF